MVPPTSHKVPRVSWYSGYCRCLPISITRLSLSMAGFPKTLLLSFSSLMQSITPDRTRSGLGSFPFARRYSENHSYFLFLQVLRCFSSLRLASSCLCIRHVIHGYDSVWVPPFGYRRLFTCLPLTVAFRCLLRPSSPECA